MKQILREEDMPLTGEFRPSAVLGAISRAKNEMLDPTFLVETAANHRERTIARLATRYQERLRKSNALDFDDLLLEAVRLFEEAPEVLAKYQERWRYLHVDEYQDTNRAQYLWVRTRGVTTTWPWSATTTRASTAGAARTCATSSTSSATIPARPWSSWSRTTAPRSSSWTPRTPSWSATKAERTRGSGRRTRAARSSSASRPTARTRSRVDAPQVDAIVRAAPVIRPSRG
jgi:hypothetical protein